MQQLTIGTLAAALAVALVAPGSERAAQADEFFGLEHTAVGAAELQEVPDGLSINNLGSTGKDGVDITIPPPPADTRVIWTGDVGGLASPALSSAADVGAVGHDGSGLAAEACSMHVDFLPGDPRVTFDFSALGPGTLGARYYAGGALVLEEGGVEPALAFLGLATLQPADIGFSAHFDNIHKVYILDGTMSTERTLGGVVLPACDHFEVYHEGALPPAVEGLDVVRLRFEGVPEVVVTNETYTVEDLCPADLNGDSDVGFGDILTVIGAWGPCGGCAADVNGDGAVGFGDILAVIAAWGPCGG